eukprot:1631413-Rhodomonas_salina.5
MMRNEINPDFENPHIFAEYLRTDGGNAHVAQRLTRAFRSLKGSKGRETEVWDDILAAVKGGSTQVDGWFPGPENSAGPVGEFDGYSPYQQICYVLMANDIEPTDRHISYTALSIVAGLYLELETQTAGGGAA